MNNQHDILAAITARFNVLKQYCENEEYKGWDPYDGLNSLFLEKFSLKNFKIIRLAWIQFFKKCPINFRRLFKIDKEYNPKGLGLFLSGYSNLYRLEHNENYLKRIIFIADKILKCKTNGYSGDCWGYNFDWQSRLEYMPKFTPTVVVTSFVACSLFDAFDCTQDEKYLQSGLSSCNFIINDLKKTIRDRGFIFSYSPLDRMRVYNASLLGSKLLIRSYSYTKNEELRDFARRSIVACAAAQRKDGSWLFGEDKMQNWVDSFHTGYNLESISIYQQITHEKDFNENIKKGIEYYLKNFFTENGIPKYYNNCIYPIDIHCPAQFLSTLSKMNILNKNLDLVNKVLNWTINNMQDAKNGYFYYQLRKNYTSTIPFIRWAQAWMFYGISHYILELKKNEKQ